MNKRPLVLDLFCGAGGAAMGYYQAGFDVIGIDIKKQPNYPFIFIQDDAMALPLNLYDWTNGREPDLIHASPPCQLWSVMTKRWRNNPHIDLLSPTRDNIGTFLYVIENVEGAPLNNPIKLCGSMFNLEVRRHRLFESNLPVLQLKCDHKSQGPVIGVYGNTGGTSKRDGLTFGKLADWKRAMQIDWMNTTELREAIPPAYTKYIGEQILEVINSGKVLRI